jgi:hypothetical protein
LPLTSLPSRIHQHPLPQGTVFRSPGGQFAYRTIGACCLLYDREQLPWPCCSLEWRGKQPSWRRVGRRLIPDIAAKGHPCYVVEILDIPGSRVVKPLYWVTLSPERADWWYTRLTPPRDRPDGELERLPTAGESNECRDEPL